METGGYRDNGNDKDQEEQVDGQKRIKLSSRDGSRSRKWKRSIKRTKAATRSCSPLRDINVDRHAKKRRKIFKKRSSSRSHSSLEQEHVADREQARRRHKALAQRREPISDYLSSKFYGEDMTVCKVKIPRVGPPINRKVTETPQTLIEKAVTALDKGEGRIASELLWMAASLQIKNLCISSGFDILDDLAKRIVVLYLMTKFQGGRYSSISHGWAVLSQCHENLFSIDFIRKNLQHAEYFCNTLFNIFSEGKRIDYDDLTKDISYSSKIVKIKYPSIYETFKLAGEIIAFQYKVVIINERKTFSTEFFTQVSFLITNWDLPFDQMIKLNTHSTDGIDDKASEIKWMFLGGAEAILASEIKWKVRGDAEAILVMDGTVDMSLEFKGKTKKISWFALIF
uniref:Uncharacterized protein n=1 Tax=Meloidogyne incognita TaxID=6306 RepID=A0A914L496_MELIC